MRLNACEEFLAAYLNSKGIPMFEAAVLQMRKALECMAYAAIAPNKAQYAEFRKKSSDNYDYTKDFKATSIIQNLSQVNPNFYPIPITAPVLVTQGSLHFNRRVDNSLTKKKFATFYDRLGKFLHADNPWGNDKGVINLAQDLPKIISSTRLLLSPWHFTTIHTPEENGVWVVEVASNGSLPRMLKASATGAFELR